MIFLISLTCCDNSPAKERQIIISIKNMSERQKEAWIELRAVSNFHYFSPVHYDNIPDLSTVIELKTYENDIDLRALESRTNTRIDTTLKLTKDTSYILIRYYYNLDTTVHQRFDSERLDFVDSVAIKEAQPEIRVKKMDYW